MESLPQPSPLRNFNKPLGIRVIEKIKKAPLSFRTHQVIVFILTFLAYASYHDARKTVSVVKSALDPQSTETTRMDLNQKTFSGPILDGKIFVSETTSGWPPFNGSDGSSLLGILDVAFLSTYALGMYFSGHLADRMNLRIFFIVGMMGSGLLAIFFGFGYWANIHSFYYFLVIQMLAGLFQSTGWPSLIPVFGNWFGKRKRGLIMGIWNANSPVGDVLGALMASAVLPFGWGWSFAVSGLLILLLGVVVFLFLPVSPESIEFVTENNEFRNGKGDVEAEEPLLISGDEEVVEKAVRFIEACKIPGVVPFALCLFFSKLVAYTFLYWLPFYISHTAVDGRYLSSETAGNLSTLFDLGGLAGGILAGHVSDCLGARAITAASFTYFAIPSLFLYRTYGYISLPVNIILMFITGIFVNGPFSLITTAVSADLGNHSSLKGNSRAMATVTAIINGTGSVGAALGPLLTGYISAQSWNEVFIMLMVAALLSGLLLTRLIVAEAASMVEKSRTREGSSSRFTPIIIDQE